LLFRQRFWWCRWSVAVGVVVLVVFVAHCVFRWWLLDLGDWDVRGADGFGLSVGGFFFGWWRCSLLRQWFWWGLLLRRRFWWWLFLAFGVLVVATCGWSSRHWFSVRFAEILSLVYLYYVDSDWFSSSRVSLCLTELFYWILMGRSLLLRGRKLVFSYNFLGGVGVFSGSGSVCLFSVFRLHTTHMLCSYFLLLLYVLFRNLINNIFTVKKKFR
jgi:hypothetical protein